jgi:hypothetical protein
MSRIGVVLAGVLGVVGASEVRAEDDSDGVGAEVACAESDSIVGYRRCAPYATWSRSGPNVFAELGVNARFLVGGGGSPSLAYRRVGTPAPEPAPTAKDGAIGFSFVERIGVRITSALYLAVEAELGSGMEIGDDANDRALLIGGAGVAGLRLPLHIGSISAEIAGGGRVVEDTGGRLETTNESIVEVRGRASLWVSPWCTLGAVAGKSLINRDEWMMGVFLSADTYAFAGDR